MKNHSAKSIVFLAIAMIVSLGGVAYAINSLSEGYRVLPTVATTIDTTPIGGDCKVVVTPNDGRDRFIPTKTLNEWNKFKGAAPGLGIILNPCNEGDTWVYIATVNYTSYGFNGYPGGASCSLRAYIIPYTPGVSCSTAESCEYYNRGYARYCTNKAWTGTIKSIYSGPGGPGLPATNGHAFTWDPTGFKCPTIGYRWLQTVSTRGAGSYIVYECQL